MNDYEAKKQARADRYRELAEKNREAAQSASATARKMGEAIPFGQPILVGHYSEGRDRRYRARIDSTYQKAHDLGEKADYYANKADSAESNTAISSDDPEAVTKLKEKLAKAQEKGAQMREFNKLMRKGDNAGMLALGFSQAVIDEQIKPDFAGRPGFADYQMSNNNGNIATMKKRIAGLEKRSQQETTTTEVEGMTVIDNVELNRLQLIFPGKPDEETRQMLKRRGFRWAPSEGAWQRHRSNGAIYAAREIRDKLKERKEDTV